MTPVLMEPDAGGTNETDAVLLASLATALRRSPYGLHGIHDWLDDVAARYGLRDALLVLESARVGRQAIRRGREGVRSGWALGLTLQGTVGLYTDPRIGVTPVGGRALAALCALALEADVLRRLSLHDPLTGLANRRGFEEAMDTSLARARRYGWSFALVLVDLDGFKHLNDRLGHTVGDTVLRGVADVIDTGLRRGDAAARVGGDEFGIILQGASSDRAAPFVQRLREGLAELPHGPIGCSVGVATAPSEAIDADELYELSDRRLYEDKTVDRH